VDRWKLLRGPRLRFVVLPRLAFPLEQRDGLIDLIRISGKAGQNFRNPQEMQAILKNVRRPLAEFGQPLFYALFGSVVLNVLAQYNGRPGSATTRVRPETSARRCLRPRKSGCVIVYWISSFAGVFSI
jgi:hypothetical protein